MVTACSEEIRLVLIPCDVILQILYRLRIFQLLATAPTTHEIEQCFQ